MDVPEIRAHFAPWWDGIELLIRQRMRGSPNKNYIVKPEGIEFTEISEGIITEPSLRIDRTAGQVLMDDLWASGLRPTEGSGSAGSLKATEKHLGDMRTIVAKKLDIQFK